MTRSGSTRRARRLRRGAVLGFCLLFAGIQLLVPLRLLPDPNNKPFGWQMYSAVSGHHFEVVLADGSVQEIDPGAYVMRYRSEVDYREHLPRLVCQRIDGAVEVVASNPLAGGPQSFQCPV